MIIDGILRICWAWTLRFLMLIYNLWLDSGSIGTSLSAVWNAQQNKGEECSWTLNASEDRFDFLNLWNIRDDWLGRRLWDWSRSARRPMFPLCLHLPLCSDTCNRQWDERNDITSPIPYRSSDGRRRAIGHSDVCPEHTTNTPPPNVTFVNPPILCGRIWWAILTLFIFISEIMVAAAAACTDRMLKIHDR